jgi:hypothetical protein
MKLDLNSREIWTIEQGLYLLKQDYQKPLGGYRTGDELTEMQELHKKLIVDVDNLLAKVKGLIEGI